MSQIDPVPARIFAICIHSNKIAQVKAIIKKRYFKTLAERSQTKLIPFARENAHRKSGKLSLINFQPSIDGETDIGRNPEP